ncbi:MAG: HipA domain-containing protein [Rhodocyclaceae bacterium]|nr:HipA domain-containing protein [Rhodocyclaceae bacterium]MBX3670559.1 HipA domain-containing protein [Rhodocyclaceae bacterium]
MDRQLYVFAHIADGDAHRFVPAGRLTLHESAAQQGAQRRLASEFAYGTRYLKRAYACEIDPVSLSLRDTAELGGRSLFPANGLQEFGGIRDAAPDAWGRRVIEARRKVPANSLAEADYLLEAGGDRVGALDVRPHKDSPDSRSASDLQSVAYLLDAAAAVESGGPIPAALLDLLGSACSAGGARPKASVRDDEGGLWLAKFPARGDRYDMARAEHCTLQLARRCALHVPETRYLDVAGRPVVLVRRFDRFWAQPGRMPAAECALIDTRPGPDLQEARLPFVSGLTMLGCEEAESPLKSYADLAQAVRRHVLPEEIMANREELFARMVFNIFASNDDDHLRNHGFLFDVRCRGWVLSPLYDVVPRPGIARERSLHLQVGAQGKLATLDNALSQCSAFVSERSAAMRIIRRIWGEVRQWRTVFEEEGADGRLVEEMGTAFRRLEEIASSELVRQVRNHVPD